MLDITKLMVQLQKVKPEIFNILINQPNIKKLPL